MNKDHAPMPDNRRDPFLTREEHAAWLLKINGPRKEETPMKHPDDPSDWEMEQGYREELARLHANDAQMPGEGVWDDPNAEDWAREKLALASGEVTDVPLPRFTADTLARWGELPF